MTAECPICYEDYNDQARIPRILKECGHTVCETCAEKLMKQNSNEKVVCPFDKRISIVDDVDSLPKNYAFLQIMDEKEVKKPEPEQKPRILHCSFHPSEEARFLCTSSKCEIKTKIMCTECMVENGKHEGHSYTSSKKLQAGKLRIETIRKKILLAKISQSQNLTTLNWFSRMLSFHYMNKKQQIIDLYTNEIQNFKNQENEELRILQEKQEEGQTPLILELREMFCEKSKVDQAHSYISQVIKSEPIFDKTIRDIERQLELLSINLKIQREDGENFEYPKCPEHPEEIAIFYCKEPKCLKPEKLMCQECMADEGSHEEHSYTSAKKFVSNQEKLKELLSQIENQRDSIEKKVENLEKEKAKSLNTLPAEMNEIKKKRCDKIQFIQVQQDEAIKNFRYFCEENHRNCLVQRKKMLESMLLSLTNYQNAIENMMENGTVDEEVLNKAETSVTKECLKEDDYIPLNKYQLSLDEKYNLMIGLL